MVIIPSYFQIYSYSRANANALIFSYLICIRIDNYSQVVCLTCHICGKIFPSCYDTIMSHN